MPPFEKNYPTRPMIAPVSPTAMSRVGNGSDVLPGIDGRSATARRYREILSAITLDLGGQLTETQNAVARRAAALAIWCEEREAEMVNGNTLEIAEYTTAANALRRLMSDLGYQRVSKDVSPTLSEIMNS